MKINVENVELAIKVMRRVIDEKRRFSLKYWQSGTGFEPVFKEDDVSCNTICCFLGWLALSPEFQNLGVFVSNCSNFMKIPVMIVDGDAIYHSKVACELFGIPDWFARPLCGLHNPSDPETNELYGKSFEFVKPLDVIVVLEKLKSVKNEKDLMDFFD